MFEVLRRGLGEFNAPQFRGRPCFAWCGRYSLPLDGRSAHGLLPRRVRCVDAGTGEEKWKFEGHTGAVTSMQKSKCTLYLPLCGHALFRCCLF